MALINVFPVYWVFASAMKSQKEMLAFPPTLWPENPTFDNYRVAWNSLDFARYFINSLILVTGTVLLRVTACAMAAYSLSRLRPPFAKLITVMILLLLMIPSMAYFVPQYVSVTDVPLLNVNLINTWWAVWLPGMGAPVLIYLFKNFFDQIPDSLFEASALDGAGAVRTFVKLVLPLSKPVIAVAIVYTAIQAWQDFLWPFLVMPDPQLWNLEVGLYRMGAGQTPITIQMAAMAIATIPMIIIFLLFQRNIMAGVASVNK